MPHFQAPESPKLSLLKALLTWSGVLLALASFVFLTACPRNPDDKPQEGDTVHSALPETIPVAGLDFGMAPDLGGMPPAPPVGFHDASDVL